MSSSEIRARARQALTGKWPMAVLVGLVAALLGGVSDGISLNLNLEKDINELYSISPEFAAILMGAIGVIGVFAFVFSLVMMVLGSVVRLGYCQYNLKLVDGKMAHMGDLFSHFDRFGDAFLLRLLMLLFTFLWSLLFVIPGIIAAYKYAMAPYILLEDPNCTPLEAINRSKEMMEGHKGELFVLELSFIGWALLSVFTLGIGGLFLTPYTNAADAVFYRDLQAQERAAYQKPQDNTYYTPEQ